MITKDALDKFKSGGTPKAPVPDWESFRQGLMSGTVRFPSRKHPFLFAGEQKREYIGNVGQERVKEV